MSVNLTANLSKSHYTKNAKSKSCPRCSRGAKKLVFHPLDAFGMRTATRDGVERIQPWCMACRNVARKKGRS